MKPLAADRGRRPCPDGQTDDDGAKQDCRIGDAEQGANGISSDKEKAAREQDTLRGGDPERLPVDAPGLNQISWLPFP